MNRIIISRKFLYLILIIIVIAITSLTLVYAALNVSLSVDASASVLGSNWFIRFCNPIVMPGSVSNELPVVMPETVAFNAKLEKPGDFYEFTVDVYNGGSIDARLDKIEKITDLTEKQSKYISYVVEYANGDAIGLKQIVPVKTAVTVRVKIMFKTDISASDLPTVTETIKLSLKLVYSQADIEDVYDENGNIIDETDSTTQVNSIGKTYNVIPGMTLYDAINRQYDLIGDTVEDYPRASEYTVYTLKTEHVFLDADGKIINLKKTVIEVGDSYSSVQCFTSATVTSDDLRSGNYITPRVDVYAVNNINSVAFDEINPSSQFVPILASETDTYFELGDAVVKNKYASSIALGGTVELTPEVVNDYVIGYPKGQTVGCGTLSVGFFVSFMDVNGKFIKIDQSVNHNDVIIAKMVMQSNAEGEPTYDEIKASLNEKFQNYGE